MFKMKRLYSLSLYDVASLVTLLCIALSTDARAAEGVTAKSIQTACKHYSYVLDIEDKNERSKRIAQLGFNETIAVGRCMGFVDGFVGVYGTLLDKHIALGQEMSFCPTSSLTNEQFVKIFMQYIDRHPEQLSLSASDVMTSALQEAYPCKKS